MNSNVDAKRNLSSITCNTQFRLVVLVEAIMKGHGERHPRIRQTPLCAFAVFLAFFALFRIMISYQSRG